MGGGKWSPVVLNGHTKLFPRHRVSVSKDEGSSAGGWC